MLKYDRMFKSAFDQCIVAQDLLHAVADKFSILLDIVLGRLLHIFGGWLERMLIYTGLLPGLLKGWYHLREIYVCDVFN